MLSGIDFIRAEVDDAVAVHSSLLQSMQSHEAEANDPRYRDLCDRHLPHMREHQLMLEELRTVLGSGTDAATSSPTPVTVIRKAVGSAIGMAQSLGGKPGMTGTLTIRYRRPHPLHTEIRFEAELLRVEGRKIFTAGRSYADGELRAEAEGLFISVDFSKIAELMARRSDDD